MFKVTKYPHGTISWADCISPDTNKSRDFYTSVMGWEAEERVLRERTPYIVFKKDGEAVAALSQMLPDVQKQSVPPHWQTCVTVDNVDKLANRVTKLGGKIVLPPFDFFEEGRALPIQDPTGAYIILWEPKNLIGAELVNTVGAMGWNELGTRDLKTAKSFYSDLLGWTYQAGEQRGYQIILNNGRMNGGMISMTEEWEDMPPYWMVYFTVENLEDTLEKVKTSGGKVDTPIIEAGARRFAVVFDSVGAVCTLIETDQVDTWDL